MASGSKGDVLAREYLRVSKDRSGRERSNSEQQDDNRAEWADFSFVDPPYSDAVSASRFATKTRGDFETLIGDLGAGRFGADVLVLWEGSRGSRRVGEWVVLIELCEEQSVRIAVTTEERVYDPANPRDRKTLLENATDAEYESAKISKRTKRAQAANAVAGRPNGRAPFGYRRLYDPETRQLVAQEPHPEEAPVVVEVFKRIAAGHSMRSIAKDFEARGVRTRSGKVISSQQLRAWCRLDAYRGKRRHTVGSASMGDMERRRRGTFTDAVWPALVDERTWLAVQNLLDDPTRQKGRPSRARYLLSMIARCDPCGGPTAVTYRPGRGLISETGEYYCRDKGCVRTDRLNLDAYVTAAIVGYLSRPDNVERLVAEDGNDDALAAARLEVAKIRKELEELGDEVGRGEVSALLAARAEPQILQRLKAAETHETALATPSSLRGLIEPGEDVAARWGAAPIAAKRRVARMLLVPELLGELRVTRNPTPGRKAPTADRVNWRTSH